jgi:3-oxoacyl-[acyl-carrier-protein] synthase II
MGRRRIVITGMGLVSCFGTDKEIFYDRLLQGESGVAPITEFQVDDLPTRFAAWVKDFEPEPYVDRKLARRGDPFLTYAVYAGKRALEDSGLLDEAARAHLDRKRCGVIIGSGMGGMTMYTDTVNALNEKGVKRVSPFFVPYIITNMGGALLAIDVGFQGPNYSISTACATGNYSVIAAAEHIRRGEADLMLAGGVEGSKTRVCLAGFVACRALSERNDDPKRASRPFDEEHDGFVLGEGGAVLVLEEYEHAKRRGAPIYAEYLGGKVSCDAYHITAALEDGSGQATCVRAALEDANVPLERVSYINTHATATKVGDEAELAGLRAVFEELSQKPLINATKSMIGHALGGASALELIAAIMGMNRRVLHPTINLQRPIPGLLFDALADGPRECKVDVALKNSFGFGGHNSCVVLCSISNDR